MPPKKFGGKPQDTPTDPSKAQNMRNARHNFQFSTLKPDKIYGGVGGI